MVGAKNIAFEVVPCAGSDSGKRQASVQSPHAEKNAKGATPTGQSENPIVVTTRSRHAASVAVPTAARKDKANNAAPGTNEAIFMRGEIASVLASRAMGTCRASPHAENTSTARALFTLLRTPGRILALHIDQIILCLGLLILSNTAMLQRVTEASACRTRCRDTEVWSSITEASGPRHAGGVAGLQLPVK